MTRRRNTFVLGAVVALLVGSLASASAQDCKGDCDGTGETTLGDVQSAFNVFLGTAAFGTCSDADIDQSLDVSLGEVQRAFNDFLDGCGGSTVGNFVSQIFVAGFGTLAQTKQGSPPPPSGAAAPTVQSSATVVNGGSSQVTVESDDGFNRLFLGVRTGSGSGAGGSPDLVPGFLQLDLPEFVNGLALEITTAQDVPADSFSWITQIVDRQGRVSDPATTAVDVVQVGTGDVQVSVSWMDAESDVDLHVVEPSGEEIFYSHRQSETGGTLDLDSNAGCNIDNVKNENITWPSGQAPHGVYIVRLDYWSSCGVIETPYVVTVQVSGQEPMTFRGTFDGPGDQGIEGDGVVITQFTF